MVIGKYRDGRDLGYDHATHRFAIGTVEVSARAVADYDSSGQLFWSSEQIRDWFYGVGPATFDRSVAQAREARETLASLSASVGGEAEGLASGTPRSAAPASATRRAGAAVRPDAPAQSWQQPQPQPSPGPWQAQAPSQPYSVQGGGFAPQAPMPGQASSFPRGPMAPGPYGVPAQRQALRAGEPPHRQGHRRAVTIALVVIAVALLVAAIAIGVYLGNEAFDAFQALEGSGDPLGGDGGSISFMT